MGGPPVDHPMFINRSPANCPAIHFASGPESMTEMGPTLVQVSLFSS